jgi:hypothetical protein
MWRRHLALGMTAGVPTILGGAAVTEPLCTGGSLPGARILLFLAGAELLTGIEGASSRPVRRIVLRGGQ